jgi:hypothetical protein
MHGVRSAESFTPLTHLLWSTVSTPFMSGRLIQNSITMSKFRNGDINAIFAFTSPLANNFMNCLRKLLRLQALCRPFAHHNLRVAFLPPLQKLKVTHHILMRHWQLFLSTGRRESLNRAKHLTFWYVLTLGNSFLNFLSRKEGFLVPHYFIDCFSLDQTLPSRGQANQFIQFLLMRVN